MCSKSWCETAVSFRDRSQTGKDVVKEEEGGGVFFRQLASRLCFRGIALLLGVVFHLI